MNRCLRLVVDVTPPAEPGQSAARATRRPRIGIVPPGHQPAALTSTHTPAENRAFLTAVRREARERARSQRYFGHTRPKADQWPALTEIADVAVWLMRSKPTRLTGRDDKATARQTLVHAAEFFQHRGEMWLWRVVEYGTQTRRAHLGLHLEVIGPMCHGLRRQVVIPWSEAHAPA